jgi:hypothetical protein
MNHLHGVSRSVFILAIPVRVPLGVFLLVLHGPNFMYYIGNSVTWGILDVALCRGEFNIPTLRRKVASSSLKCRWVLGQNFILKDKQCKKSFF